MTGTDTTAKGPFTASMNAFPAASEWKVIWNTPKSTRTETFDNEADAVAFLAKKNKVLGKYNARY